MQSLEPYFCFMEHKFLPMFLDYGIYACMPLLAVLLIVFGKDIWNFLIHHSPKHYKFKEWKDL